MSFAITLMAPILPRRLIESRLARGTFRYDEDGILEKRCTQCGEYWPADTEFFLTTTGGRRGYPDLGCYCRACYYERYPHKGRNKL